MNKNIFFGLFITMSLLAACNQSGKTAQSNADSITQQAVPPPADNNSANNPSLADTAYGKKDTVMPKAKP